MLVQPSRNIKLITILLRFARNGRFVGPNSGATSLRSRLAYHLTNIF
jgi:hypothetical protein